MLGISAEYMSDLKQNRAFTPKENKNLFKLLEEQELQVWCALLGPAKREQIEELAEEGKCSFQDLVCLNLPLDKLGLLINKIYGILHKRHCVKVWQEWHKLEMIRDRIFLGNMLLVLSIAKRYKSIGDFSPDDVVQEGNTGLIQAIYRFDWRKGFAFSTYATHWIRHHITRALMNGAATIRIPVHILENEERRLTAPKITDTLDRTVGEGDLKLSDAIPDEFIHPRDELIDHELAEELHRHLDELPEIQRAILVRRFGFVDDNDMTLKEIGDHYGLSRERIRQLEAEAILDLQGRFKR
jgi:RNA polymerase sigma factor (sigma-70 family)